MSSLLCGLGGWAVVGTQTSNAYSLSNYWDVMFSSQVCSGACTEGDTIAWSQLVDGVNLGTSFSLDKKNYFINNGSAYGVNH